MNTTYIRNKAGTIIGSIETNRCTGVQVGRTYRGNVVGTYDSKLDRTHNVQGSLVSVGNTLAVLIWEKV